MVYIENVFKMFANAITKNFINSKRFNNYIKRSYCTSTSNSGKLLAGIAELSKYGIELKHFPTFVLVGPQSSGKSSVVHGITGYYILPTDMKIATRKPTHITTIRSIETKFKVGDREYSTAKEAANEIERLNKNEIVKKIDVIVNSPNVYNSNFIDLPGLFSISDDSTDEFRKDVKNMALAYASNKNLIPIIVHAAPSDPATNSALKLISNINRRQDALGILTKIDMVENQKIDYLKKMLDGSEYKIGLGYCAVVLSNDLDIEKGKSVEDKIVKEEEYFKKRPSIRPAGVPTLRKMISDIQAKKIIQFIPEILVDIDNQIESLKTSNNFLTNLLSDDHKKLSINLRVMIEKLVGSSQERAEFENELKKRLQSEIVSCLENNGMSNEKTQLIKSKSIVNDGLVKIFNQNKEKINVKDEFKQLFSYGIKSPIFVDNTNLNEKYNNEMMLGLTLSLIEPYIDDNLGTKRVQWNKQLNTYITKLLKDDNIHRIIKSVTNSLLLEYIYKDSEFDDPISKKFAEYMINEISNEAFESKIKFSISAMLNLEKRPCVSLFEIARYFVTKHPEILRMPRSFLFTPEANRFKLEVFSQDWTEAYSHALINSITENAYRNVATTLLDKIVESLLIMMMDILNKDNALKEQNKINQKITKLMEIKGILLQNRIMTDSINN